MSKIQIFTHNIQNFFITLVLTAVCYLPNFSLTANAIEDVVQNVYEISATSGNLSTFVTPGQLFATSVQPLGDLNGDGIQDVAVGQYPADGGFGALHILFLESNGTVGDAVSINNTNNPELALNANAFFGYEVENIGDLDGDGVIDLAVSALGDNDGGQLTGAIFILFLNSDGTLKDHQEISATQGGFTPTIGLGDLFGNSIANIGDLDGDGVVDLISGMPRNAAGATDDKGLVWVIFLNVDGTVKSVSEISDGTGGLTTPLDSGDYFGLSVDNLGDFDNDSSIEVIVTAPNDDDGGADTGAAYILSLDSTGSVIGETKISSDFNTPIGLIEAGSQFGAAVTTLDDLNKDGVLDIAVASSNGDGGLGRVSLLYLNTNGEVVDSGEISNTQGGFNGYLSAGDNFSNSLELMPDFNNDGQEDLLAAAGLRDDGGTDFGTLFLLTLNPQAPDNIAPQITSAFTTISVFENNPIVDSIQAVNSDNGTFYGGDEITFTIDGGSDAGLFDIDSTTGALEFITAPDFETPLDNDGDNMYEITIRVTDNGTPALSTTEDFIVSVANLDPEDTDGVDQSIEELAPNNGDGNDDGVVDSIQNDVASIPLLDSSFVTIDGNGCDLTDVQVIAENDLESPDENFDYPNGLIEYTGNCTEINVDIYVYGSVDGQVLRKFNDTYFTIENYDSRIVFINGEEVLLLSLTINDGGDLDASEAGDGVIKDPLGFGVDQTTTPNTLIRTGGV